MVIRSMNSIFSRHGRVLFGIVTFIIIVSFMGFMTQSFTGIFERWGSVPMGTIFGEKIKPADLQEQQAFSVVLFKMQYPNVEENIIYEQAGKMAFNNLSYYRASKKLGIVVSDSQVNDFLQEAFSRQDKFDAEAFNIFVNRVVKPLGLTQGELEEAVRRAIAINEMNNMVRQSVVVTPGEVEEFYKKFNQSFMVQMADFNSANYIGEVVLAPKSREVELTVFNAEKQSYEKKAGTIDIDENVWDFYEKNAKNYMLPVERKGLFIEFKFDDPKNLKAVEESATVENLKKFFEENRSLYSANDPKVEFDAVKTAVKRDYVASVKKSLATLAARRFSGEVLNRIEELEEGNSNEVRNIFLEMVSQAGLDMGVIEAVAVYDDKVAGIDAVEFIPNFIQTYHPITSDVAGKNSVFVGFVTNSTERNWYELPNFRKLVEEDYKRGKALEIARLRAKELVDLIEKLPVENRKDAIAKCKNPVFAEAVTVSPMTINPNDPKSQIVYMMVEMATAGTITQPIDLPLGAMVMFVDEVKSVDMKDFETSKDFYEMLWTQEKFKAQLNDFQAWINANCFENVIPAADKD